MNLDLVIVGILSSSDWSILGKSLVAMLFLAPGTLLTVRFFKGSQFPWWMLVGLSLIIGWACMIGASLAKTQGLSAEIKSYEARNEPIPDDLMEDWANDAHGVFALFFGWAFAAIILTAWLVIYALAVGTKKAIQRHETSAIKTSESTKENLSQ